MIHIQDFTFNSFQTRCSVVWDDSLSCAIVDPGCSSDAEISELTSLISSRGLKPVCIMLTHGHFDHVLGVAEVAARYSVPVSGSADSLDAGSNVPHDAGSVGTVGLGIRNLFFGLLGGAAFAFLSIICLFHNLNILLFHVLKYFF